MSRPFSVNITRVTCYATQDYTGGDELAGQIGPVSFPIGTFDAGDSRTLDINQVVPAGEFWLIITEKDLLDSDDTLGQIDLSQDMDVERTVLVEKDTARYEIRLLVTSVSD